MKHWLTITFTFLTIISFGQNNSVIIDTSNYYDYANNVVNLNWLRTSDAVPIIIDEIKKSGFSYAFISVGELLKINDSSHLVLTVSYDNDVKFGFVYEDNHGIPLNKGDRDFMSSGIPEGYSQVEKGSNGRPKFMRIKILPTNTFLLKETCYWYEYGHASTKTTVTKDIAEYVLRQDIRKYLTQIKK